MIIVRLWHKDLIAVLPDMQLKGQWRECVLIARALNEGNLNHVIVNRVKDYPSEHFWQYCGMAFREMQKWGYKTDTHRLLQWNTKVENDIAFWKMPMEPENLFSGWHNTRYLRQCLYNLEEKAIAGGIPYVEWVKIADKYGSEFDLWR